MVEITRAESQIKHQYNFERESLHRYIGRRLAGDGPSRTGSPHQRKGLIILISGRLGEHLRLNVLGKELIHGVIAIMLGCCSFLYRSQHTPLHCKLKSARKVSGENLQPASLRYQTAAGRNLFHHHAGQLSGPANLRLQNNDGSWLEISNANRVGWILTRTGIPSGSGKRSAGGISRGGGSQWELNTN